MLSKGVKRHLRIILYTGPFQAQGMFFCPFCLVWSPLCICFVVIDLIQRVFIFLFVPGHSLHFALLSVYFCHLRSQFSLVKDLWQKYCVFLLSSQQSLHPVNDVITFRLLSMKLCGSGLYFTQRSQRIDTIDSIICLESLDTPMIKYGVNSIVKVYFLNS